MSTKIDQPEALAGGLRSEPGGRAQRPAGGVTTPDLPDDVRDRLADEVIDELLAGARTEEEIVGPGGVLSQLTKRLVERALQALPAAQRVPLVLYHMEGLQYHEIATRIGVSIGKVKTDIFRGRESLRRKLRLKLGNEDLAGAI